MNKKLFVLPIAALVCGKSVNPPRLKPALWVNQQNPCLALVEKEILIAYAYKAESKQMSELHSHRAKALKRKCEIKSEHP